MKSISLMKNEETGSNYELWHNGSEYRLRTWRQSPSGVVKAGHSITLTEDEVEQLAEDIHTHLFGLVAERKQGLHCFRHDRAAFSCGLRGLVSCDFGEVTLDGMAG